MDFSERMIERQDVPQEVAAGQVGAVRLAARSVLAAAVQKVAEDDHLPVSEKQTLSALSDALSLAEGDSRDRNTGEAEADAGLPLTGTRPIRILRGVGNRRDTR